jgi:hypothetical protein
MGESKFFQDYEIPVGQSSKHGITYRTESQKNGIEKCRLSFDANPQAKNRGMSGGDLYAAEQFAFTVAKQHGCI